MGWAVGMKVNSYIVLPVMTDVNYHRLTAPPILFFQTQLHMCWHCW